MNVRDEDARILVRFRSAAAPGAALLIEDGGADAMLPGRPTACFAASQTIHAAGCRCCLPRGPVSLALGRLFLARARGEVAFFDVVVAVTLTPAGAAAVRAALQDDVVTRARFRLAPDQPA